MKRPQTAALGRETPSNRSARVWMKLYPRQPLQDQPGDDADGCAAGDAGKDKHREVGEHFLSRFSVFLFKTKRNASKLQLTLGTG